MYTLYKYALSQKIMLKMAAINFSLGTQAYQELKSLILERRLTPGEKINEGELARAMGISRTPIREALNRLAKEGLVNIYPQRGAFVVEFSEADVEELFLIRERLEGLAAYLAAERITSKDVEKLENCVQGFVEPFTEKEIRRYAREDFKFHQTIVALSAAPRLISLVSTLHDYIRVFRLTTIGLSGRMKNSLEEHKRIISSLKKKDPLAAEDAMRAHIIHVRQGVIGNIHLFIDRAKGPTQEKKEEKSWPDLTTKLLKKWPKSYTYAL